MNFTKYTTKELEFITNNIELFKKELKKRQVEESDNLPFKANDIIHTKNNDDNYFLKIMEIDRKDNTVCVDEIVIRNGVGFNYYEVEWLDIDDIKWCEYTKIENSEIFENLLKIVAKYSDDAQQLRDDTYLKLKNKIATLW